MKTFLLVLNVMCFVTVSEANEFWGQKWNGIRINVEDVRGSVNGTSDCVYCNQVVDDAFAYVKDTTWRLGYSEFVKGVPSHVIIVKAHPDARSTPYIEVVKNGFVTARYYGYKGNIEAEVFARCPIQTYRKGVVEPKRSTSTNTQPIWYWPSARESLRQHLVSDHGYSWAEVNSMSFDQLIHAHNENHVAGQQKRSTSVVYTSRPLYGTSPSTVEYYSAPPVRYVAPTSSYYQTQGIQVFGTPVFGTYSSGGSCINGMCIR